MSSLCVTCGEAVSDIEEVCTNCGTKNDISHMETMVDAAEETLDSNVVSDQDQTVESKSSPSQSISSVPPSEDDLIGKTISGAVIKKKIGKGGMGSVFLAHHLTLDIPVAIKFLKPEYARKSPDAVERFLKEARAVAKLRHPNIVSVYNAGFEEGFYFMSMEFIKGRDLSELLESPFHLSLKDALKLTCNVCDALHYAHKNKIVHRDIKPANIFIDEEGNAKVGDLGLAKDLEDDQSMTQSMQSMGTPYYISPEQATSAKDVDHRSDIYSLGCTFYRLFCGKVPFKGNSSFATVHKHLSEPVPDPLNENPDLPAGVAEVIKKMMAKKPEERYQDLGEVSKILGGILDDISDSKIGFAPRQSNTAEPVQEVKKGMFAKLAALAVVVTVGLIVFFIAKPGKDGALPSTDTGHKGVISSKPQAIYFEAQKLLNQGDYIEAEKLFNKFFETNPDAIDAHQEYTVLLKQSEGIEGAREKYRKWYAESNNPSVGLVYLMLIRGEKKSETAQELEKKYPDFAPYYYFTSLKWKDDQVNQTFAEKREELRLLKKFTELDSKGYFLKYFVSRQTVEEMREDAAQRLKNLLKIKDNLDNPVSLKILYAPGPGNPSVIIGGNSTNRSMLDVGVTMSEAQNIEEVFYRVGEEGDFENLWKFSGDQRAYGLSLKVEDRDETVDIFIKYTDKKGYSNGPYKATLVRSQEKVNAAKKTLSLIKSSWVSFRDYDNRLLLYFTSILSYAKGLKEIRYSLNNSSLDKKHPFDAMNPYENVYITLPPDTEKVFVQLKYKDDSLSEIMEYGKPENLRKE